MMKIVFINNRKGVSKTLRLPSWAKALCSLCLIGVPLSAGLFLGVQLSGGKIGFLVEGGLDQREERDNSKKQAEQQIQAMSLRLAEMQARLVRLDALGERLTDMADLDDGEFDFSHRPAMGGPESDDLPVADRQQNLRLLFNELEGQIDSREYQLDVLESLLVGRELTEQSSIAGKPVVNGWISSPFGTRTDPFTGKKRMHQGVDFAGKRGDAVVAVGSGVVTWSGSYQGYGNLVEIDHGEGVITRYGHNQSNLVQVGDLVQRGDVIANMGSTGRSTGPHLHFEVYKHGRVVDPAYYIRKTLR